MPDHIWLPDSAKKLLRELPWSYRSATQLAIMALLDDPIPPDARAFYVEGEQIPDAYELDVTGREGIITVYYVVSDAHIMIQVVRATML